ncbi:MAG: LPS assembly lipoprotein LptE [Syntrophobacteraceae bacterium]
MRRFIGSISILAISLLMVAGCGYHFTGEGSGPRPGIKTVAIPIFENTTSQPELGSQFAGALRREFMQKGPYKVVSAEDADVIFRGRVTKIETTAVAHHEFKDHYNRRQTLQSRIYVTLDIRCEDPRNGTVVWQDPNFTYFRVYRESQSSDEDPMVAFDNRRDAMEFLANEMAIRIHDRFLNDF